ncbi:MAG TPA: hypothetical protein VFD82_12170 [Planctomycetota bacterium]|nr:hypothetical protein [Planctomycetota bacterium]
MRNVLITAAVLGSLLISTQAQERSGPKKPQTFAEAIETAKKAVEADKLGAAIAALQAAVADLQKKQRAAILAALPKPDGWQVEDQAVDEQAELTAGMLGGAYAATRHYRQGEKSMHVEVTANSPLLQMGLAMVFNNPALIEADGGELVKYGQHKAILKKAGDNGQELTILMHDAHLIKVTSEGIKADDLLKVFDQACIDRLEKPLGR